MRGYRFLFLGILFGIVMVKSEAISWYRIQEMFRFQSIHMYGIIGVAVFAGIGAVAFIKKWRMHDIKGNPIVLFPKEKSFWRYILGGSMFGLGWALSGSCPGPMFVSFGYGFLSFAIVIGGALLGTFLYGVVRRYLPH
ncbi:MAG: YeeE/YedE family protein [Flammeovirgaceae bacterium]|nr:YeeE/YedE family protein [Flammeovirgaceae bacterium]